MVYNGLCIVPIRRKVSVSGYVSDIMTLPYLDNIVSFTEKKRLALTYLSCSKGLVYYDTFLTDEVVRKETHIWDLVVSEQIYRLCLSFSIKEVWMMTRFRNEYQGLIGMLNRRGIKVYTPIHGVNEDNIPKVLQGYVDRI